MLVAMGGEAVAEPCAGTDSNGNSSAPGHVQCLRQEAEQGDRIAQFYLGFAYYMGDKIPQDRQEAAKWIRRSADQGYSIAQYVLALMYAAGFGVPKDIVREHVWLNLLAAQGLEFARRERDSLETEMTPAQIAEAQKLAREWKPKPEPER
jgi:hypothetical protein